MAFFPRSPLKPIYLSWLLKQSAQVKRFQWTPCLWLCYWLFLCFAKVCLSHRLQVGTELGLGALHHSMWLNVCSNRLAIRMKALWVLSDSMNFQSDKQLDHEGLTTNILISMHLVFLWIFKKLNFVVTWFVWIFQVQYSKPSLGISFWLSLWWHSYFLGGVTEACGQ